MRYALQKENGDYIADGAGAVMLFYTEVEAREIMIDGNFNANIVDISEDAFPLSPQA